MGKIEIPLEEYVAKYYQEVKDDIPSLIKYVDLIFNEILYFSQVHSIHEDKFIHFDYHSKFDKLACYELCIEILGTIDPSYQQLFQKEFKKMKFNKRLNESYMDKDLNICIRQTKTIEDALSIIHEFFHKIHIQMYGNNIDNPEWYFASEMIAMTFELYGLFYLYKQDRYRDDIKTYFNKLFNGAYTKGLLITHEALILDVYDNYHSIDEDKQEEFKKKKRLPKEVMDILELFNEDDGDMIYHENATYVFGYPISLMTGLLMAYNPDYKEKVLDNFKRMNTMSIEEFISN